VIWQSDGESRSAALSECGTYRYVLRRVIAPGRTVAEPPERAVVFLMLNPSTASGLVDDPTILRCKGFAERWTVHPGNGGGVTDLFVVNIFALRTPHPQDLLTHPDPVGPETEIVFRMLPKEWPVIAAWGSHKMVTRERLAWLTAGRSLQALGTTQDGSPKHPLARGKHRIPDAAVPRSWALGQWRQA
jgi:hypothetical protein